MDWHAMKQKEEKASLVLMAGLPGAGKTTLAYKLGQTLRWLVLDKDVLKSLLMVEGLEVESAGSIAYELLFELAEDILVRQQLSVILDSSALHHFILERATAIAHSAGARLKVILCVAESEQRKERIRTRKSRISQLRSQTTPLEDDPRHFTHLPADTLILSTVRPLEEYVEVARHFLLN